MPTIAPKNANRLLWTAQIVLAVLFLLAGGMKLVLPLDALKGPIELPGFFVRFIGVAEVLGALGLILPGLFRIRPQLTSLAACGLVGIMAGATVLSAVGMGALAAVFPFFVGLVALAVFYGRGVSIRANPL